VLFIQSCELLEGVKGLTTVPARKEAVTVPMFLRTCLTPSLLQAMIVLTYSCWSQVVVLPFYGAVLFFSVR
jgi:hypothetical protein